MLYTKVTRGTMKKDTRFLKDDYVINLSKKAHECLACEANSLISALNQFDVNTPEGLEKIKEALIFILETTDYPSSDQND
jgi:hypothetical protein